MSDAIICAQDVRYQYEDSENPAVNGVTLDVPAGEFLAVLGRNGSGKSTFAKLLNALLIPTSGTVTVDGRRATSEDDCYPVREVCGMVFQNPDNQIVATTVEEDCAFGPENLGVAPEEIRRRVDETLAAVGMAQFAQSSPSMLSGGQKQRVAVAGVLVMRPKIIVFDESTAMLDPVGRRDVFSLARKLNREEGITVVWITHFMDEAVLADRVAVMDDGKIAMLGAPREVFAHVDEIRALGLDVPEMMRLAAELRRKGLKLGAVTMTVEEMVEELCRLKSKI
ncbi:MAG TPA: energy-coupling factor transporter ATPase [Candidatus Faecivicinus avistercoris]|nr:energy-coupling factor transporter ATPase [Candidatus Faecivicinus avistercoris]